MARQYAVMAHAHRAGSSHTAPVTVAAAPGASRISGSHTPSGVRSDRDDWTRAVLVVGHFRLRPGSEAAFELAFLGRPPRSGPRPPVQEVHFARAQDDPAHYLRVSMWRSPEDWEEFQGGVAQQGFWAKVSEYLSEAPRFEFYDAIRSDRVRKFRP